MNREFIGIDSIEKLASILSYYQAKKIFLVSGKKSFENCCGKDRVLSMLKNCDICHFDDFSPNPKLDDIRKGIEKYNQFNCEIVIAIGGGSTIDMSKLINVLAGQSGDIIGIIKGESPIKTKGKPLIAIPTTSGTGSETTHFAVAFINKKKYSLAHEFIFPEHCIVDPTLSYSLSAKLTAATGFDALSQGVESYWSVGATSESRIYATQAIQLILPALKAVVNSPREELREAMSIGAHMAGKAINISKTTAPHAISYTISTFYGIPHGHAVALTLGEFFEINDRLNENDQTKTPSEIDDFKKIMLELFMLFGCENAEQCRLKWYQLMKSVGLEFNYNKLGIKSEQDIDFVVGNVNLERLSNHPVSVDAEKIRSIFEKKRDLNL